MSMKSFFNLFTILFFISAAYSIPQEVEDVEATRFSMNDPIPVNPDVTIGHLDNGIRYYIKENKKPENRAALWLAVNAGSVLEDEDQRGLAHFVEHMGFNGTENFKKHELIDFLESIGMKFGPEINAYTSFDETVYFINVPTDSNYYLKTGIQILEEWAHNVSFEDEEIDKERGVVGEEWRLGRGAQMRMLDEQLPVLFHNSRYAERLPIGKKEIIDTFDYETLRRFYKDWYRPDLMAVVAVGDFDKEAVLTLIKESFSSIPTVENPRERKEYPVPDHDSLLFAIASDKEADRTQISLYFKSDALPKKTVGDYRTSLMLSLYSQMLNRRLNELTKMTDPPFLFGYTGQGDFVRTKGVYYLGAGVVENGVKRGLSALITEAMRVKRHGFTDSEFERTKSEIMRSLEKNYKESEKTESFNFARGFVSNFLNNDPIPNAGQRLGMAKQLLPSISLEEINKLVNELFRNDNRVVLLSSPENEEVNIPSEEELKKLISEAEKSDIEPYVDLVKDEPLLSEIASPGDIVAEKYHKEIDVTELHLSNGIKVFLKSTDFKNDEILFNAFSFGGNSLIGDDDIMSARTAAQLVQESGIGEFSNIELSKKLTGKVVNVRPYIRELYEGIRGNASPEDIETMFKLIYLYFTSPRSDDQAFESYMNRMKGYIENRNARPETAFYDTIQVTISQYHKRARPWSIDLLDEIEYEKAIQFYKERFADAGDFNFFFVGNLDLENIKAMLKNYIASLPNPPGGETWKDTKVIPPKGVVEKSVYKGIEEKSRVQIIFHGDFEYNENNVYSINSLVEIMRIKLREVLREDMGGTYGVSVRSSTSRYPREKFSLSISFGCDPERVDEMMNSLNIQIDSLKNFGTDKIHVDKVRELQSRNYELNLKKNGYWLGNLFWSKFYDDELSDILNYQNYVESLSNDNILEAAKKYLDKENFVQVIMYPEADKGAEN